MYITITNNTTVGQLRALFREEVGGTLHVYNGRSLAPDDARLISLGAKDQATVECSLQCSVGSFVDKVQEVPGLTVRVYTADDWVAVLDEIPLSFVRHIPRQATKASMGQLLEALLNRAPKAVEVPLSKMPTPTGSTRDEEWNARLSQLQAHRERPLDAVPAARNAPSTPVTSRSHSPLVGQVRADVAAFLTSNTELFFNERDFQVHLALYLKGLIQNGAPKYDDVELEYFLPGDALQEYTWEEKSLRLDIVVCSRGEFVPVELKYKTKTIPDYFISRFGEEFTSDVLKTQSAQNLGCYEVWKDVRRVELVRRRYRAVPGGLAVFLSNDPSYWKETVRQGSAYLGFSVQEGSHPRLKSWHQEVKIKQDYPEFEVEQEYAVHWQDAGMQQDTFRFFIIEV